MPEASLRRGAGSPLLVALTLAVFFALGPVLVAGCGAPENGDHDGNRDDRDNDQHDRGRYYDAHCSTP